MKRFNPPRVGMPPIPPQVDRTGRLLSSQLHDSTSGSEPWFLLTLKSGEEKRLNVTSKTEGNISTRLQPPNTKTI